MVGRNSSCEFNAAQIQFMRKIFQFGSLAAISRNRQSGFGEALLNDGKGAQHASYVIHRPKIAVRQKYRLQWFSLTESKSLRVNEVKNRVSLPMKSLEHIHQINGWNRSS